MAKFTTSQIRSTKTYLWYISDVLGTGATSTVYKGRHKKTGDLVAAKAFNNMSFMRPQSVQQREFDVLLKLNHKNIVRLFDIEQDQITKNPVIIMELCSGGSLFTILEDPVNCYGLEEDEFKQVLVDVCAGMKHLRDLGIVHRDIKPGNIMKVTCEDGTSVYKLADFGAARELQDDENFMSLYGTEEYLHPDLYERAVLRQPSGKAFSARIDLWSIGVTFYHVATGMLPFRPFGGRKNRETMFRITTQKASGVISGVQRDSMDGPVEWSSELPKMCRLSGGLKVIMTNILQGLLECTPDKMWTFGHFFEEVQALFKMKVIDVFHVASSEMHKIYIEPERCFDKFQQQVVRQTNVQLTDQSYLWDRETFRPDLSLNCEAYPTTSTTNPVILLGNAIEKFPVLNLPLSQIKSPKMSSTYDLDKDASMSKMCLATLYYLLSCLQSIVCMQELMTTATKATRLVLTANVKKVDYHRVKLKAHAVEVDLRLFCVQQGLPKLTIVDAVVRRTRHVTWLRDRLQWAEQEIMKLRKRAESMSDSYRNCQRWLSSLLTSIVEEDQLNVKWAAVEESLKPCYKCLKQFSVIIEESRKIFLQFKKDKQAKQLSYNEEQIHKMDKEKFNIKTTQATSMFQSHCEVRWTHLHNECSNWFKLYHHYQIQIDSVEKNVQELELNYQTLLLDIHMLNQKVQADVTNFTEILQDTLLNEEPTTAGPSSASPTSPRFSNVGLTTAGPSTASPSSPRFSNVAPTNAAPSSPVPLTAIPENSTLTKVPVETADVETNTSQFPSDENSSLSLEDMSSITQQIAHLPVDSTGYVHIPKDIKALFDSWERHVDTVNNQVQLSQQQLENIQQSLPSKGASNTISQSPVAGNYERR